MSTLATSTSMPTPAVGGEAPTDQLSLGIRSYSTKHSRVKSVDISKDFPVIHSFSQYKALLDGDTDLSAREEFHRLQTSQIQSISPTPPPQSTPKGEASPTSELPHSRPTRTCRLRDRALPGSLASKDTSHTAKRGKDILIPKVVEVEPPPIFPLTPAAVYIHNECHNEYCNSLKLPENMGVVNYDMQQEDEVFLSKLNERLVGLNATRGVVMSAVAFLTQNRLPTSESGNSLQICQPPILSEVEFLKIIDRLEKVTGFGSVLSADQALMCIQEERSLRSIHTFVIGEVYKHWVARRAKVNRPLLRQFWPTTPATENGPYAVFRARPREKMMLRRPRRNVVEASKKFAALFDDFCRVEQLLRKTEQRDKLKLAICEFEVAEFDQLRHERIDPTYCSPTWKRFCYKVNQKCLNASLYDTKMTFKESVCPNNYIRTLMKDWVKKSSRSIRQDKKKMKKPQRKIGQHPYLRRNIAGRILENEGSSNIIGRDFMSSSDASASEEELRFSFAVDVNKEGEYTEQDAGTVNGSLIASANLRQIPPRNTPSQFCKSEGTEQNQRQQSAPGAFHVDKILCSLTRRRGRCNRVWVDRHVLVLSESTNTFSSFGCWENEEGFLSFEPVFALPMHEACTSRELGTEEELGRQQYAAHQLQFLESLDFLKAMESVPFTSHHRSEETRTDDLLPQLM